MRRLSIPILAVLLLLAAGCGRKDAEEQPVTTPPAEEITTDEVTTDEPAPAGTIDPAEIAGDQPVREESRTGLSLERASFAPMSGNAMGITGDVTFNVDIISFAKGQTITTRLFGTVGAGEAYSSEGRSWADLMYIPAENDVEIRQVIGVAVNDGAQPLCGGDKVRWVGIGTEASSGDGEIDTVSMALITGEQPPNPAAAENNVCSTLSYTG